MATGDKKRALMTSDINDAVGGYGVVGMDKKGAANGVAELGADGKVPSSQLPATSVPSPSSATPQMDGVGAAGSSTDYARGDHVHPSDTAKLGTSGDGSNVTAAFTAASSRTNISTGEKLSVLFGKIAKWFTDLGTAAFRAATSSITQSSTDLVESGAVYTGLADKQAKVTASGILKGDGAGGISAATAGTDYQTPLTAGTDYATPAMIPSAYSSNPAMDGTADPGSSTSWAKGDHVHPTDTSRMPLTTIDSAPDATHTGNLISSAGVAAGLAEKTPVVGKGINLLRNAYFIGGGSQQGGRQFPINERGQTSYSGKGYTIDGWYNITSITTQILSDKIKITDTSNHRHWTIYAQYIANPTRFAGKRVTISAYAGAITGDGFNLILRLQDGSTYVAQYGISLEANKVVSFKITVPSSGFDTMMFAIQHNDGTVAETSTLELLAAKFEFGDTQTLAHQESGVWVLNDPAPDFEYELFKCQTSHADTDTYANKSYATGNLIGKVLGIPPDNRAGQDVSVGEYAIVNNELYECNTAITASMTPSTYMSYLTQASGGAANELKAAFVFIAINADTSASFGLVDTGLPVDTYYVVGAVLPFEANYSVRVSNLASPGNYRIQIIDCIDGSVVNNGSTYFVHIAAIKRSLFTEIT